jgi:5-aminolevulinate synthase
MFPIPAGAENVCPHAKAGAEAARKATELAKMVNNKRSKAAVAPPSVATPSKVGFNYEAFYHTELQKKHQDKSYRYFNNINRLAAKFPVAHTGNVKEEVDVWCSNDYLGMSKNPVVLETIQCVAVLYSQTLTYLPILQLYS